MEKKEIAQGIVFSWIATLIVFLFHYIFPSMINNFHAPHDLFNYSERIGHGYLETIYQYHTNFVAFAVRPLTSFCIQSVHSFFDLSYGNSFILVNFALLFLVGIALYILSREWKYTHKEALISLGAFLCSFSILFSFFSSIYSYDEPLQYLCIFLSLIFLYRKQGVLFLVFFTLAIICRETTLFLLPALFLFSLDKDPYSRKFSPWKWKRIFFFAVPLFGYILFKRNFLAHHFFIENLSDYTSKRLDHFFFNFQNIQYSIESVLFCILVLLPALFVIVAYKKELLKNKFEKKLLRAFFVTLFINTLLVFFTARAREARLFALPLIFLWPILGKYFIRCYADAKAAYVAQKFSSKVLLFFVCLVSSFCIGFGYHPTAAGNFDIGYHIYIFLTIFLLSFAFLLRSFTP